MKLTKKDGFALLVVAAIITILVIGAKEKATRIPHDARHQPFFTAIDKGGDRATVEKGCLVCHNPALRALPGKHPPKEQCLICHKAGYRRD